MTDFDRGYNACLVDVCETLRDTKANQSIEEMVQMPSGFVATAVLDYLIDKLEGWIE